MDIVLVGDLCHKLPKTIYGVQMPREEIQVIWFETPKRPLKELRNLMLPLRTSFSNIQKQIHNQDECPQGKTILSRIALRTTHL
jgi:hypothetical protein